MTVQDKYLDYQNILTFSFESNVWCMIPQRFVVKELLREKARVRFWRNKSMGLVAFWAERCGGFLLGKERSQSFGRDVSDSFEGLQNTTRTGKNGNWFQGPCHHCTRLVAIQLE